MQIKLVKVRFCYGSYTLFSAIQRAIRIQNKLIKNQNQAEFDFSIFSETIQRLIDKHFHGRIVMNVTRTGIDFYEVDKTGKPLKDIVRYITIVS